MSLVPFDTLPDDARLWVFPADRPLDPAEREAVGRSGGAGDAAGSPRGAGDSAGRSRASAPDPFWDRPDIVARFASRDADHRLAALIERFAHPRGTRVLDVGCAGGRNTVFLAERGFDVLAVDASAPMVEETRRRLAAVLGPSEASARVHRAPMDDLGAVSPGSVDLVVALGIFHCAAGLDGWHRAVGEAHRVLAHGGLLLYAGFTDACRPEEKNLKPVPGQPHVFEGMDSGRTVLLAAEPLDREMARAGFAPFVPTETVVRATDGGGRRVTANALFTRS